MLGEVLYVFWLRVVQNFRKVHLLLPTDFEMQLLNAGTAFLQRVPLNDLCAKDGPVCGFDCSRSSWSLYWRSNPVKVAVVLWWCVRIWQLMTIFSVSSPLIPTGSNDMVTDLHHHGKSSFCGLFNNTVSFTSSVGSTVGRWVNNKSEILWKEAGVA